MKKKKENYKSNVKTKLGDVESRILDLETSINYFSKAHSDIVHNLNSSTHKLLSYSYILGSYVDYFESLINMYQDQELKLEEIDSKIKKIDRFENGVEVESIRKLSAETVKSIDTAVRQIHKESKDLHLLSKELDQVI